SPFSLFEYIHFVVKLLFYSSNHTLPNAIGYVKSKSLTIKSSLKDENSMPLEFTCRVLENKLKLIAGDEFWEENQQHSETKESVKVDNLPDKDEISRYISSKIPIVAYASEERFKDLFMSLKEESKLTSSYVIFIILSTLLASIGLLVNSAAVIIGAMILAPLMAPIVSFSMGLLRSQKALIYDSLKTILIGIVLALGASYLFSLAIPFTELTSQMQGRIHPSLLDLGVAILSGVAAAYAKSYKEIAQNLAGVAIAVALVPPLATSGIGLGRGDFLMFYQAFLLFFTNLVGISLAATVTFLFLGYSNALKNKLGFSLVFTTLLVISIPLYLSYKQIASTQQHIEKLTHTRFIVNSKYVIINSATIDKHEKYTTVDLSLFSRENLDRYDLEKLKEKIEHYYGNNLQIRVKIEYIL
ncbi:MAG: TIGR00341 family protein, partial [Campylobacterota bacterium]|nr:TIGR00341 family protein [Campylobacterota bacterium]